MRPIFAICILLTIGASVQGAYPKPLWEIDVSGGKRTTGPGWLSYSPDGQVIATVVVQESSGYPTQYRYQLRVWNASNQKEKFTADLGSAKTPHLGDELASFTSDDGILTGGENLSVRSLENGQVTTSQVTGGSTDHTVWSVPDLQESFYLRRDPLRFGLPAELFYQSSGNARDDFNFNRGFGRRGRFNQQTTEQTTIHPPREGLQTENIAMNFGRTHLAIAFRDENPSEKPRHALVRYEIKTVEDFGIVSVAEAENPPP